MRRIKGLANGLRSGPWSENKLTNQVEYSPYDTEIYRITKESERLLDKKKEYCIEPISRIQNLFIPQIKNKYGK
ncbi:hypothetical protein [Priestia megaterium]|uniref:hypothetical protein n=1 Tax=Priestia megaterium TaxID=1404 RepID=UPI003670FB30